MLRNLNELKEYDFVKSLISSKLTSGKLRLLSQNLNEFLKDESFRNKFGFEKLKYSPKEALSLIYETVCGPTINSLIHRPDSGILKGLIARDSRVRYVATPRSLIYLDIFKSGLPLDPQSVKIYSKRIQVYPKYILTEVAKRISRDFGMDKKLVIRGITTTIGLTIPYTGEPLGRDFTLLNILETLQIGCEMPNVSTTRVMAFTTDAEKLLDSPVNEFLQFSLSRFGHFHHNSINLIFPALLVYDWNKFGKKRGFTVELPNDPLERSGLILGAYIMDRWGDDSDLHLL